MAINHDDAATATLALTDEQRGDLENYLREKFIGRAEAQGFGKPTSAKYRDAEANFYAGAMSALVAIGVKHEHAMRMDWIMTIMCGDSITVPRKAKAAK
jgi:hypothetical protein